jgi:ribokinase
MGARVVIVGSVNEDLNLAVARLPEPGETVGEAAMSTSLGGKGANAAVAVARLGGAARLVARVGGDQAGADARARLDAEHVGLDDVLDSSEPTGVAIVVTDDEGENLIVVAPGANGELSEADVAAALERLDDAPTAVLANLEVPTAAVLAAARMAQRRGWPFVLDPAPPRALPNELIAACTVLVPNRHELELLHPNCAEGLLELGARAVVTTLGSQGAELWTAAGRRRYDAYAVEVRNTVGAGDAFAGGLALRLAEGVLLEQALDLALAAGALATRGPGAQASLPSRDEAMALIARPGWRRGDLALRRSVPDPDPDRL